MIQNLIRKNIVYILNKNAKVKYIFELKKKNYFLYAFYVTKHKNEIRFLIHYKYELFYINLINNFLLPLNLCN